MLKIEKDKPMEKVWTQAVLASISTGVVAEAAIQEADEVALAFDARFGTPSDDKMGATYSLSTAIKYLERSFLCGKKVMVIGTTDVPGVGTIRDFRNQTHLQQASCLVKWESGGPEGQPETWITIERLQLIAQFGAQ